MSDIARGVVKRGIDLSQSFLRHFGEGAVATNGVQYSSAVTVNTTAVVVFNELIDPGFQLKTKQVEVGLTFKTTHLGSTAGSLMFYWQVKSDYRGVGWFDPVGTLRSCSYVMITNGTMGSSIGSAVSNSYEHTLSGYLPVASLPAAPIRLRLIAEKTANQFTAQVKSSSYVKLVGVVIPGN